MGTNCMTQRYVRLTVDTMLSDEQLDEIYDLVDDAIDISLTSAIDDNGILVSEDIAITMYSTDDSFVYEMIVNDNTKVNDMEEIISEIEEIISTDFEIELIRE